MCGGWWMMEVAVRGDFKHIRKIPYPVNFHKRPSQPACSAIHSGSMLNPQRKQIFCCIKSIPPLQCRFTYSPQWRVGFIKESEWLQSPFSLIHCGWIKASSCFAVVSFVLSLVIVNNNINQREGVSRLQFPFKYPILFFVLNTNPQQWWWWWGWC